ncbi:MAG: D-alanine--D-alanine ligase [Patescibacteria group bacterium]
MRVGVLRGGKSSEYEVSLRTGQTVLKHLPEPYQAKDILIDKSGVWHLDGLPISPAQAARQVDVFWNAMHGEFGEDGQVQRLLEELAMPYTGSESAASALGMNKEAAKQIFRQAGFKVPPGMVVEAASGFDPIETAKLIFQKISPPWVVKPVDRGSSVGLAFARTVGELAQALADASAYSDALLVEHYLRGREATCGVVEGLRGQSTYALPPIEIRKPGANSVWTYEDKYSGATEEICPATFPEAEKKLLEELSVKAHEALGLRHYSRSDFIITPHGIYLLETNSLPGLTTESLLPKALAAIGTSYPDFLDHVIKLAVGKR